MKQHILLIDDSAISHAVVHILLGTDLLEITSAHSAAEGIQLAESSHPDLILLDVDMPEMDGFEVCKIFKGKKETADIPVIFLSGMLNAQSKAMGLSIGAVDYVTKPFERVELIARVSAALRTKELMDTLAKRALLDGMTNIWNRSYFDDRLAIEISRCIRHNCNLGCIVLDVDYFKQINDTFGHPAGDHVLKSVAKVITGGVRHNDVLARIGGEEFAILASDTSMTGTMVLAERLRRMVELTEFEFQGRKIRATCSLGVANTELCLPEAYSCLVQRADKALYSAKRGGRNCVIADDNDHRMKAQTPSNLLTFVA